LLFYFTSYVLNMFRTLIYPSPGACDYSVELPHWSYCSWFDVCWSFGVVGLEWYPCCRLQPATRIPLQPNPAGQRWFLGLILCMVVGGVTLILGLSMLVFSSLNYSSVLFFIIVFSQSKTDMSNLKINLQKIIPTCLIQTFINYYA